MFLTPFSPLQWRSIDLKIDKTSFATFLHFPADFHQKSMRELLENAVITSLEEIFGS